MFKFLISKNQKYILPCERKSGALSTPDAPERKNMVNCRASGIGKKKMFRTNALLGLSPTSHIPHLF